MIDPTEAAQQLMDFGESRYPHLFPSQQRTRFAVPFLYRYYPETNTYLGVWHRNVYVMGGSFPDAPELVGSIDSIRPTTPAANPTLIGEIVSAPVGNPVSGATITDATSGILLGTTDSLGKFNLQVASLGSRRLVRVNIAAANHLTRSTNFRLNGNYKAVDLISTSPPFSLEYYLELARNAKDLALSSTAPIEPYSSLTVWDTGAINVYIRTIIVDPTRSQQSPVSTGIAVPQLAIDRVLKTLPIVVSEVTGGKINIRTIELGTEDQHQSDPFWIRVQFFDREKTPQPYSGNATPIGTNRRVYLGLSSPTGPFACHPIGAGLIFHELGHAMGLYHTSNIDRPNMMSGGIGQTCDEAHLSATEKYHGRLMYSRPAGNKHPDFDPEWFFF